MDIKEKLKSELRNAGLNEGLADIIAVNDESHIKGAVESLQKLNKPSSLDDVLKDPIFQSEFDKRISKAIETSKKKNVVPPVPDPDPEKDDVTKLILGLQKSVSDLQGQVSGNQQASAAKDLIGKSKLPDTFKTSWLSRIDTNSEASISEQISGLESEYDVLAQSIADNTDIGGAPPSGSATSAAMSREELKKALGK